MFLYGKNSVFERLKRNPASIKKVFLEENFAAPHHIEELLKANKVPAQRLSSRQLARIKPAKDARGIIAEVDRFKYTAFEELLQRKGERPSLIFLDRVNDPQNFGAIIRTAGCFGGFAVVIPGHRACEVNETVLHVAQGGENFVPLSLVSNLSSALIAAKKAGYWIVGASVEEDAQDINKVSFIFPLGFILGSEEKGIRYGLQNKLDIKARIPMQGAKLSFNVSIACAIFCHQICRQREGGEDGE